MLNHVKLLKQSIIGLVCTKMKIFSVLDLGTGVGGDIELYIQAGIKTLIATDIDEFRLDIAQQHFEQLTANKKNPIVMHYKLIDLKANQSAEDLLSAAR